MKAWFDYPRARVFIRVAAFEGAWCIHSLVPYDIKLAEMRHVYNSSEKDTLQCY